MVLLPWLQVDANLRAAGFQAASDFDSILSADLFERLKPFPDIFEAAAANLGEQPRHCIVIEDASSGVQAAKAAGMRCIGVLTTLSEPSMKAEQPDSIKEDISHITLDHILHLRYEDTAVRSGA